MTNLDRSQPPAPGPIRPFDVPPLERARLANGLDVAVMTHGSLPVVTAELVVDAGGVHDTPDRAGRARLAIRALEAGTLEKSAEQIAWELEYLGIELHAETSWDAATVRMTVPAERLEDAMVLFAQLVLHPAFPQRELERLRMEQEAEILQRAKDPRALANDMAARFLFAREVPYSRPLVGTAHSVSDLSAEVVGAFHAERYVPAASTFILAGDVRAAAARDLAERTFGEWRGGDAARADFEPTPGYEGSRVFLVDRPGSVQSEIRIGHAGVPRAHPDYFALLVMNEILGGAFTSRLNLNLRERHGFTYGAQSGYAFRRVPGPFQVQAAVGTEVTARAVTEALKEMRSLQNQGVTDEEVSAARDYLAGILPLQFQTSDQVASRVAEIVTYELPDDYFGNYRERILSVSREEVERVAREHLHLDRLAIVVIGDAGAVEQPLKESDVGPVDVHRGVETAVQERG